MNWGNRLLLVFVVFACGISFLVYRCVNTSVDLVSHDYYKDELAYQQVIDATRKANALSGLPRLSMETGAERAIVLQLPAEMKNSAVTGSVTFYCPSDVTKDRRLPLSTDANASQAINAGYLRPGNYTVKIKWESGGKVYYNEQPLAIQ